MNSRLDLAVVARLMQDRLQMALMSEGVSIIDPDNTWIEADVTIGRDSTVYPFSFIGAGARVGSKCRIGPFGMVAKGQGGTRCFRGRDGAVRGGHGCEFAA